MSINDLPDYLKENCIMYCKNNNINKYRIEDGRYLIFNISYSSGHIYFGRRFTIQYKIDLESMQEVSRKPLKKFDREALLNGRC